MASWLCNHIGYLRTHFVGLILAFTGVITFGYSNSVRKWIQRHPCLVFLVFDLGDPNLILPQINFFTFLPPPPSLVPPKNNLQPLGIK